MKEILITSSVLILALLLLRVVFKGRISARLQYALWGIVLVRLLIPISLPASDYSLLTVTAPVEQLVTERVTANPTPVTREEFTPNITNSIAATDNGVSVPTAPKADTFSVTTILNAIWITGMAVTGAIFLVTNIMFLRKLRRERVELSIDCKRKVYIVQRGVISSPCLFGGAIYLTPSALRTERSLRHVICHEETHAKHLDPLWSVLRSLCLVIYWFDPLVWIAAFVSKSDCELACDEAVIAKLGEGERIEYGETLLSLVSSNRGANPLLSATTMTSGKRRLRERISRIARKPERMIAAGLAAAMIAVAISACAFSAAKGNDTVVGDSTVDSEQLDSVNTAADISSEEPTYPITYPIIEPLTESELSFFEYDIINYSDFDSDVPITRQFANPWILYDDIKNIDLYELFYLGTGEEITDEEIRDILDANPNDLPCPAYKLSAEHMDEIFKQYTGLSISETSQNGLDRFTYSEEYDAYYWMHGDTNSAGPIEIRSGVRERTENGTTIRLYHSSGLYSVWYCVTLSEQSDGTYWFVSNVKCEQSAIKTPLPDYEPEYTVTISDDADWLAYSTEYAVDMSTLHEPQTQFFENWLIGDVNIRVYTPDSENVYLAIVDDASEDNWTARAFASYGIGRFVSLVPFGNLFGHDGFRVSHFEPGDNVETDSPMFDYYYMDENDIPVLMFRERASSGDEPLRRDVDGDGSDEIINGSSVYTLRDGKIACIDLSWLLEERSGNTDNLEFTWSKYGTYCQASTQDGSWTRYIYFDGELVCVYTPPEDKTNITVTFMRDGSYAEPDDTGWYETDGISSIEVSWSEGTLEGVTMIFCPTGMELEDDAEILEVLTEESGENTVVFPADSLHRDSLLGHLMFEVTLIVDGQSVAYETGLYNVTYKGSETKGGLVKGQPDENDVAYLIFHPTLMSTAADDDYSFTPDNQQEWINAIESAVENANMPLDWADGEYTMGVMAVYGDYYLLPCDTGRILVDNVEKGFSGFVSKDDAEKLCALCNSVVADLGLDSPVRPEQLHGIKSATLDYDGTVTITDPEKLSRLEEMLTSSTERVMGVGCWFTAHLTLELESGESVTITMATDSCRTWFSEGVYYSYGGGEGDNSEFYALFGLKNE